MKAERSHGKSLRPRARPASSRVSRGQSVAAHQLHGELRGTLASRQRRDRGLEPQGDVRRRLEGQDQGLCSASLHAPLPLILLPFRFRDTLSGKWVRAPHKAERDVIATRYAEWEIVGPAEIRADLNAADSGSELRKSLPKRAL